MIDPNNVLIRCPSGHELQTAKSDLGRPLVCPICNTTFTPGGGTATVGTSEGPTTLSYAGQMGPEAVSYPGYTGWMLVLWILYYAGGLLTSVYSTLTGAEERMVTASGPGALQGMMGLFFAGCLTGIAFLVAMVFQLMWIYRIHRDARNAGGYSSISPGLALGLSFIPVFNWIWTAFAMKKLAGFTQGRTDETAASAARNKAALCVVVAIVVTLLLCGSGGIGVSAQYKATNGFTMTNFAAMRTPEFAQKLQENLPPWFDYYKVTCEVLSLLAVIVYLQSVRALEKALYPALGAPPK